MTSYGQRGHCPCCQAVVARAKPIVASRPTAESLSLEEHGKFLSGYASARTFFTYYKCGDCGALYCPTYYTQRQLDMLYSRQAENMLESPLAARLRTQEAYFSILARYSRMAGGYLELGCDIGLFAEICSRSGAFDHFWLCEPNREVHDQLAQRLRRHTFTIQDTTFTSTDASAGTISTAVMIHVLDHLLNPRRRLREIYKCLEPDGILFVVTHDTQSMLAKLLGRRWPPFTLQHPHLFSPQSLRALFAGAGFSVVEMIKATNYFPAAHLLYAGLSVLGLKPPDPPNSQWPMLGLRLGNIVAIARKAS